MHEHIIEDELGDAVDAVFFCSDSCHRAWCADNNEPYAGWFGAQETTDALEFCAQCGVRISIDAHESDCTWECLPSVVNLAYPRDRETFCPHGIPDSVAVN